MKKSEKSITFQQEGCLAITKAILKSQSQHTSKTSYQFHYNNINYIILGAIIETLYKKDWEDLIKEKLFIPLGMSSAGFGPPARDGVTPPNQLKGNSYTCGASIQINQSWAKGVVLTHDGSNINNYATVLMDAQAQRAILVATNDGSKHQQLLQDKSSLITPIAKLFQMNKEILQ